MMTITKDWTLMNEDSTFEMITKCFNGIKRVSKLEWWSGPQREDIILERGGVSSLSHNWWKGSAIPGEDRLGSATVY